MNEEKRNEGLTLRNQGGVMSHPAYVKPHDESEEDRLVNEIKDLTGRMNRTMAVYALEIGRRLTQAKEIVRHGEWRRWLNERVDYSQRTANNYMRLYHEYGEGGLMQETVGNLSYSQALTILDAPTEERERLAQEVKERDLTIRELREEVKDLKKRADEQVFAIVEEPMTDDDGLTADEARLEVLVERMLDDYAQTLDVIRSIGKTDRVQAVRCLDKLDQEIERLHDKADRLLRS